MERVKIAHILHSVGGVDVYLRLILENVDRNKIENIVVHGESDTQKEFVDKEGKTIKNYKTTIIRNISFFKDFNAIRNTYKILKKEKPDIIHAHSAKGGVIGKIVGKLLGVKILYTPHAFSYLSAQSNLKRNIFLTIEKNLANGNSTVLATSDSEKNRAIKEVGYKPEKVIVFNNCIEPIGEIQPLSIPKTWPDEYICCVGRPSYQKNIELMIEILYELKKVRPIHLLVIGVGHHSDQLESVKSLIKERDMTAYVTLIDWTSREDVFNLVSQSKMYISTSRYEGMPYSIIESLALSKPSVVSDCDGNRDLIVDGYNGYIVKNNNIEEFKDRILELINDEQKRKEFSANAYQSFSDHFNIKNNISKLESIYSNFR
ncbi:MULTISPECIES: glycosyltransferase [Flavobacterium]|uniref:Glycosyltransferase family 4 protein n=1 Tax=Flavobacterium supellecticarium TaxID=2565924 RepID=A0A4S3ZQ47_9FLAO|nr:glycosyltransferase [Flavobacterium supellecticarium]THF47642.1 glycosyltransferase family 4 protein [Flavobacterium supellecticarium]